VETVYTCSLFPTYKKDLEFNDKIGTIDLETYGSNSGLGLHQVYAGGWAIKDNTNLFYIKTNETSEVFISRIFFNILMSKKLDGYTFYVHNLGRFDSVFILKSLILNNFIDVTPV
jgi:hypothetical protein